MTETTTPEEPTAEAGRVDPVVMRIRQHIKHTPSAKNKSDSARLLIEAVDEIDKLYTAIAAAYGYLWCVNNEPGTPRQYPPERAAYEARKVLRELLTKEQRGTAINNALTLIHLEKGYPESRVSVGLVGYCMNLDGTVTVKVDSL